MLLYFIYFIVQLMEARAEKEDCEKEYLRCVAFKQKVIWNQ